MKLHCNACKRDFTTLSERDKDKKFAIHHLQLDKMKCPHCGASNYHLMPRPSKYKNKTSRRAYAGTTAWGADSERREPNVIVHPQCQPHVSGNLFSPEGLTCNCDRNCKSYFNCWTGNVDDGDYVAPLEKSREEQVADAKTYMEKKQKDDAVKALNDLRARMGKIGFGYEFKPKGTYARYGGTVWVLDSQDLQAILKSTWDTAKTQVIHTTFNKRGVNPSLARILLHGELLSKRQA